VSGTAVVLVVATLLTGMTTGVIALYSHTLMPGLGKTDDRTFVAAVQSIDRAIINPWFMTTFFGGPILIGVAAVLDLGGARRAALPWIVVAFALHLAVVVITLAVHVPLNDAIKAAGDPDHIDLARVRAAFHESRWLMWNHVRLVAAAAAFVILTTVLATTGPT
jgi:uncharacterized membrane protein